MPQKRSSIATRTCASGRTSQSFVQNPGGRRAAYTTRAIRIATAKVPGRMWRKAMEQPAAVFPASPFLFAAALRGGAVSRWVQGAGHRLFPGVITPRARRLISISAGPSPRTRPSAMTGMGGRASILILRVQKRRIRGSSSSRAFGGRRSRAGQLGQVPEKQQVEQAVLKGPRYPDR